VPGAAPATADVIVADAPWLFWLSLAADVRAVLGQPWTWEGLLATAAAQGGAMETGAPLGGGAAFGPAPDSPSAAELVAH